MSSPLINVVRIFAAFLFAGLIPSGILAAADQPNRASPGPAATEASVNGHEEDERLHSDGAGWKLERARRDDPSRPRVLLVGDSILGGYRNEAISALAGRAYVDTWVNPHHQGNPQLGRIISEVLAHGPYDVIVFNMGLHGWQKGRIPEGRFEELTRALVEHFRRGASGADLMWASSTPVTAQGDPGRLEPEINPVIVEHNRMAAGVMKELGVPIIDFYAMLEPRLAWARGDRFHWTDPAYALLAAEVVTRVNAALDRRAGRVPAPSPSPNTSRSARQRPNILWIIAEDMSPHLGCYGTAEVWTPNLDRLAAEGVRFERAFTTAPVCSASRSAIMTGMYQTTIGAHNHRSHRTPDFPLPPGVRIITDWMRDAGYFTANVRSFPEPVDFKGTGKTDWNFHVPQKPFDSDDWSDLKARQPFYAQVNLHETHRDTRSMKATGRAFAGPPRANPQTVDIPPYYPDCHEVRADWANYLDDVSELDRKVGMILALLERDGLADNTVVIFLSDHGQAHVRGKQWCYDSGLRVPLIIRWPRKFPAPPGLKPGTVDPRLVEAIDLTPTTLAIAGAAKPPAMQGRTLFGPTAEPSRDYAFGARDRCDETVFRIRTARDGRYRYIRNFTPDKPFLALNRYKENYYVALPAMRRLFHEGRLNAVQAVLFADRMAPEELYDVQADPHETRNLIGSPDPAHRAAARRLRAALEDWITRTNDQGGGLEPEEEIRKIDEHAETGSRRSFGRRYNDSPDVVTR